MERHSSFFSLSGFTGILIGIVGCIAIFLVDTMTHGYGINFDGFSQLPILFLEIGIMVIGILTIVLSLFILWKRGRNKAKKNKQGLWNAFAKKQRINLLLLLLVFLVILILIGSKGYYRLITPLLLSFYGLLLLNLSRFQSKSLLFLGLATLILGIVSYVSYTDKIFLLALGVGIFPIIYGLLTFNKSKKQW